MRQKLKDQATSSAEDTPKAYQDESSRRFNRAYRRQMKKALKMPFTPSQEFADAMTQKIKREEPVKVRIPRAFEKDEINDTAREADTTGVDCVPGCASDGDECDGDHDPESDCKAASD